MNAILLGTLFVLIQLCLVLSAPKGCVRGVITAYRARENILMIEEIRVQLGFSVADSDIIKSFFASNRGSRERFVKIERPPKKMGIFFFKYHVYDDHRGAFRQIRRAHWLSLRGCRQVAGLTAPDIDYDY
ncbi:hypothetical protein Q1695_016373 [Nippostrongylus brasiliensis]|nr:hypothetical protein Q1695_016373 [Nippostrongylus brasiliensis]